MKTGMYQVSNRQTGDLHIINPKNFDEKPKIGLHGQRGLGSKTS
jgi:hypothetical protein